MKHRNSQKRIYIKGGIYFITTNTRERFPFFENDLLCEVMVNQIEFCKRNYEIDMYAYKINPDHLHLLFSVGNQFTISDVMFSLKKQTAHGINQIPKKNNLGRFIIYQNFVGNIHFTIITF